MSKLPSIHVGLGLAFFALGAIAKDILPQSIGSLPAIQLPCAFFTAVMLPLGSLLALRELLLGTGSRRSLLCYHLIALIFVPFILSWYFATSILMSHVLDLAQTHSILPKLIENAKSLPNEQKRIAQAKWAYRIYGVTIAYRLDNQQVVFYEPNAEDTKARMASEQSDRQIMAQTAFVKKISGQFPYLFALYASTFIATFCVGWIWLAIRLPKDPPMPAI